MEKKTAYSFCYFMFERWVRERFFVFVWLCVCIFMRIVLCLLCDIFETHWHFVILFLTVDINHFIPSLHATFHSIFGSFCLPFSLRLLFSNVLFCLLYVQSVCMDAPCFFMRDSFSLHNDFSTCNFTHLHIFFTHTRVSPSSTRCATVPRAHHITARIHRVSLPLPTFATEIKSLNNIQLTFRHTQRILILLHVQCVNAIYTAVAYNLFAWFSVRFLVRHLAYTHTVCFLCSLLSSVLSLLRWSSNRTYSSNSGSVHTEMRNIDTKRAGRENDCESEREKIK